MKVFTWCVFLVFLDINECSESFGDNCTENANCTNTEGSYFCSCLSGYQEDGERCIGKHVFQMPYSFAFAGEEIAALIFLLQSAPELNY